MFGARQENDRSPQTIIRFIEWGDWSCLCFAGRECVCTHHRQRHSFRALADFKSANVNKKNNGRMPLHTRCGLWRVYLSRYCVRFRANFLLFLVRASACTFGNSKERRETKFAELSTQRTTARGFGKKTMPFKNENLKLRESGV